MIIPVYHHDRGDRLGIMGVNEDDIFDDDDRLGIMGVNENDIFDDDDRP
jgi:hypothetical protein